MSINKHHPHVWVIPEDDANRQLANGFFMHAAVDDRRVGVRSPAGGWLRVIEVFETEFVPYLCRFQGAHLVMLVDFDGQFDDRSRRIAERIPDAIRSRVFVVGSRVDPESLRRDLSATLEAIGTNLAAECLADIQPLLDHRHLAHNRPEWERMAALLRPIIFQAAKP